MGKVLFRPPLLILCITGVRIGLGGVTVQGNVNGISMRQDKDGNVYYNYGINGIAVSATVSIVLTGGTNQASVTIKSKISRATR